MSEAAEHRGLSLPRFDHVLVPLDGSPFAQAAMPTARALAARFEARLVTLSVADGEGDVERLRRHALDALGTADENDVRVVVAPDPAEAITARAQELGSCVVCLSTRGRGRVTGTFIGSVARAVFLSSREPIVAVGPQADRPGSLVGRPRRRPDTWPEPLSAGGVVACVDGTSQSEAVLPVAAGWATALDAPLSILTVAEDAAPTARGERPNRFGPADPEQYVDALAQRWVEMVPGTKGEVVFNAIGVSSGLRSVLDSRPTALVALTAHARSGLDRLRLGATAADIVRASTVPALVVPVVHPRPSGKHASA